ncbi:hypothetical protein VOLCADRAFT_91477 [Volvox carteri f. nagariensis]|uniref:Uncharacterized protein n=1 Tax=Volvox carteri f. nagariensis TaxID=3068 RepID=D8TX64_VOLCA|nr:uncharacterized protein VOLCADRAFT_91477 [Volvox carteri f. nagariensis]EFJ47853.1 hypothetical protein VOLCADRAFT_91477 [Volvox carteri f. nagariensis]|eukprot:XP_002950959.1 hypothetical protein VOLCADRAFT_91477 [Volvox carteri f. nagariensis]
MIVINQQICPPPRPPWVVSPLVNPLVTFVAEFPYVNPDKYPGKMYGVLSHFKSIVTINARLPSRDYVQASMAITAGDHEDAQRGTGAYQLQGKVWFPTDWREIRTQLNCQSNAVGCKDVVNSFVDALMRFPSSVLGLPTIANYRSFNAKDVVVSQVNATIPGVNGLNTDDEGSSSTGGTGGQGGGVDVVDVNVGKGGSSSPTSSPSPGSSSGSSSVSSTIDMGTLGANNKDPPTIHVQASKGDVLGDTVYQWPASESSPFVEPPVTTSDPIDSVNVATKKSYSVCRLPPGGLDSLVMGTEPGDLDVVASGLVCSAAPSLDSSRPNQPGEAFLVEYRAINSRKIAAKPKRLVVVITDPCKSSGEFWCFTLNRCSVAGQCVPIDINILTNRGAAGSKTGQVDPLSILSGSDSASTSNSTRGSSLSVPKDTTPPRIQLNGTGRTALNLQGQALMFDEVPYLSSWAHPGAIAMDVNAYGAFVDITYRLQAFGVAAVNTSIATPPGALYSFAVQYTVTDEAGNAAIPALRLPYMATFLLQPTAWVSLQCPFSVPSVSLQCPFSVPSVSLQCPFSVPSV